MGMRGAILGALFGLLWLGTCDAATPAAGDGLSASLHAALAPASAADQGNPPAPAAYVSRRDPQLSSVASWIAPGQPAGLWSALVASVLIVAAVAWSLLRPPKNRRGKD